MGQGVIFLGGLGLKGVLLQHNIFFVFITVFFGGGLGLKGVILQHNILLFLSLYLEVKSCKINITSITSSTFIISLRENMKFQKNADIPSEVMSRARDCL
jgi:hypothetical protein